MKGLMIHPSNLDESACTESPAFQVIVLYRHLLEKNGGFAGLIEREGGFRQRELAGEVIVELVVALVVQVVRLPIGALRVAHPSEEIRSARLDSFRARVSARHRQMLSRVHFFLS